MTTHEFHLRDANGKPFFWLADTAWNLWCKGTPDDWAKYLDHRQQQGFNVVQFVPGWWRGCMNPIHGKPFDLRNRDLTFNDAAWKTIDACFEAILSRDMVPSPVMLWTLTDIDPGQVLTESQCVEVASRYYERYQDERIVWLLGGDGDYTKPGMAERWKRIGRAVFGEQPRQLATLHPCGVIWVSDRFQNESWYRLATIQSGHGARDEDFEQFLRSGYVSDWRRYEMPVINLEPNYEAARSYGDRILFTAFHVRRASYWSVLLAPTAGVTYGIGSVWMWATQGNETAENHDDCWVGQPWHEDLDTDGARSVCLLKSILGELDWTELRPATERLTTQPGNQDLRLTQALSITRAGHQAVAYCPAGTPIKLATDLKVTWKALDPATGETVPFTGTETELKASPTRDGDVLFIGS